MCPCMWAFCINYTISNQLLIMSIFFFFFPAVRSISEVLQPYWIQLCLLHSLSMAWWWQELSLSMPQSLGQGLCAGSGSSIEFLSSVFCFSQAFLPVSAVSSSFILKPLTFLKCLSLKICCFLKLHSPKSTLGTSLCPAETGVSRWLSS